MECGQCDKKADGQSCRSCADAPKKNSADFNHIKRCIAVMSGKGGVGKSLTTGLLATALRRRGMNVGILDADITGPSIPRMFGIKERPAIIEGDIFPVRSRDGINIISLNLFMDREDDPVVWRGPLISGTVKQFWEDVLWGELDYLLVDMPPGTADVPLTVMQTLPLQGVVIVTSPQDLALMIVNKAVGMARMMEVPILGLVENMSYLSCPDCGRKIELFGPSRGQAAAAAAGIPFWGRIPIDPALSAACDNGTLEDYQGAVVTELAACLGQD